MLFDDIYDNNYVMFLNQNDFSNKTDDEGFLKGNMFKNEYKPYKNYTYIMPKLATTKDKDLFEIMKTNFELNDYNLYLDVNPDDKLIYSKFKNASEKLDVLTKEFEKKYGPINLEDSQFESYKWFEGPWPWQRKDSFYV